MKLQSIYQYTYLSISGQITDMLMVQVAILVAIAIGLGLIFRSQITAFVNSTFSKLVNSGF